MKREDAKAAMLAPGFGRFEEGTAVATGSGRMNEWFRWRLNRLRCMTVPEISYRLRRAVSARAESIGLLGPARVPAPDFTSLPNAWIRNDAIVDAVPYLAAADRIAAGRLDVFALRDAEVGSPPRWNRDPKTGIEAPMRFGKLLDYRDAQVVGDIKYLWEPNRHLHLVTLAQAFSLSCDSMYFDVLREHLESWFAACPYRMGANWSSSLEAAIRLINWSVAWQLLGGARSPHFEGPAGELLRKRWVQSVYQHVQFVRGHLSLHSSANNHLIGEAAGLFIAALTWPHWRQSQDWLAQAKGILEREARLQIAPDGVSREQSTSYQRFVLELLMLTLLAGKANGQWLSVTYESRIETMLEFLASVMDVDGNVPMLGDADDGLAVKLAADCDPTSCRSLLATGALLFRRGDFKLKAGLLDDRARWLVGRQADTLFAELSTTEGRLPVKRAFPEGGYYILGCEFEGAKEIRLIVDAGPLGYQSIAAHGHADALAFTLSVGGMEFMIDPGTYAYHTEAPLRRWFRGTAAHNTVCVDGQDQSQQGGNFMWLRKARAGCTLWSPGPSQDVFEGWQDGYMSLPDPVMHRRRIELDKASRLIVIEDRLQMAGAHEIELHFHCSERCIVTPRADGFLLLQGGVALRLRLPFVAQASTHVFSGSTAPLQGWVSRRFDQKLPGPAIVWRARLANDAVLRTEIAA